MSVDSRRSTAGSRQSVLDDKTVAYVLDTRKPFEDLRQVAAELAGLLVLAAAGSTSVTPDHPMLQSAERLFSEAADGLQRVRSTPRARDHHGHLLRASAEIRTALACARSQFTRVIPAPEIDEVLTPLRAGYAHLGHASRALPGFELVSFEQGCCGASRGQGTPGVMSRGQGPPE